MLTHLQSVKAHWRRGTSAVGSRQGTIRQGEETVFAMEGSIALNENPTIEFDYRRNGSTHMTITARDTDAAAYEHTFPLGPNS